MPHLIGLIPRDGLTERLIKIKEGSKEERDTLIQDYIPFIIKTISKTTNRYVESENSEEYSVGLEAFNEAIDKYNSSRGSFMSFATLVIRSRVIDYLRKQHEQNKEYMAEEEIYGKAEEEYHTEDIGDLIALRIEIKEFENKLKEFGISFCDLVKESPKHRDTRMNALKIARHVFSASILKEELKNKRRLPTAKLIKELGVSKKLLNRSRTFIIAAVLILDSNMDSLKGYIAEAGGGAWSDL